MIHILEHSFLDSIKIIPVVFLIYFLIEYLEHKNNTALSHVLMKSKRLGPVYGSLLGSVPQCGFSMVGVDLFAKGTISLGTLIAIFISTSDEAIPLILSYPKKAYLVIYVILIKIVTATISGFLIDFISKSKYGSNMCDNKNEHKHYHSNCENCENGIFKSTALHTVKIFAFIFIANFLITFAVESIGEEKLAAYLLNGTVFQPFIAALIGLIPNCAASVILTQSFLENAISFGSLIAGLSSGAGVGMLLLFKQNKNIKENISIIVLVFLIGALSGVILQCLA